MRAGCHYEPNAASQPPLNQNDGDSYQLIINDFQPGGGPTGGSPLFAKNSYALESQQSRQQQNAAFQYNSPSTRHHQHSTHNENMNIINKNPQLAQQQLQ